MSDKTKTNPPIEDQIEFKPDTVTGVDDTSEVVLPTTGVDTASIPKLRLPSSEDAPPQSEDLAKHAEFFETKPEDIVKVKETLIELLRATINKVQSYQHQGVLSPVLAALLGAVDVRKHIGPNQPFSMNGTLYGFSELSFIRSVTRIVTGLATLGGSNKPMTAQAMERQLRLLFLSVSRDPYLMPVVPAAAKLIKQNLGSGTIFPVVPRTYHKSPNWPILSVCSGITLLIGGTGSAKTQTLISKVKPSFLIRFGEPMEEVDVQPICVLAGSYTHATKLILLTSFCGFTVALDSLRSLVYSLQAQGGTTEGGVAAAVFDELTALNNLIGSVGGQCLATINPLVSESKIGALDTFVSRMSAAVAAVVVLDRGTIAAGSARTTKGRVDIAQTGGLVNASGQEIAGEAYSLNLLRGNNRIYSAKVDPQDEIFITRPETNSMS